MVLKTFQYKFPAKVSSELLDGEHQSFNVRTTKLIHMLENAQDKVLSSFFGLPTYHLGKRDHRGLLMDMYLPMKRFNHEGVYDPEFEMFRFKKVYTFAYIKHYVGEIPKDMQSLILKKQKQLEAIPIFHMEKLWILAPSNEFDTLPGAKAIDPIVFQEFVCDNKNLIIPLVQWI